MPLYKNTDNYSRTWLWLPDPRHEGRAPLALDAGEEIDMPTPPDVVVKRDEDGNVIETTPWADAWLKPVDAAPSARPAPVAPSPTPTPPANGDLPEEN